MRLKDQLNKIEYFCAIGETGSLKKASEKVLIGQPQLTKIIQQLEETLATTLLIRSSRGVTLTSEGQILYDRARKILKDIEETEYLIKSEKRNLKGAVRIGTYDSIARYFFPDFLKYLKASFPEVKIFIETGRSEAILRRLAKGELDLSVVISPDQCPRGLVTKKIYSDSFALYSSPSLEKGFSDLLIYLPFEMNETEASMKKFGFYQAMVCDNLETVKSLCEQGIGVGLLPTRVAKESVLKKKLTLFHHPKIKKPFFDQHDIIVSHSKKNEDETHRFVLKEIERFLELWSNR